MLAVVWDRTGNNTPSKCCIRERHSDMSTGSGRSCCCNSFHQGRNKGTQQPDVPSRHQQLSSAKPAPFLPTPAPTTARSAARSTDPRRTMRVVLCPCNYRSRQEAAGPRIASARRVPTCAAVMHQLMPQSAASRSPSRSDTLRAHWMAEVLRPRAV